MVATELPVLQVSRPALALVDAVGYGRTGLSFDDFQATARRPRTTLTRYLNQLTRSWLVLRVRQNEYAVPDRATFARLLIEPSAYVRSLLLYANVLEAHRVRRWAFACLPIRRAFPVEIRQAIPVLRPDERLTDSSRARPYAEALWWAFDDADVHWETFARDDQKGPPLTFPVLKPRRSLALLTASLDPRFVQGAEEAARRLDLDFATIVQHARRLWPEHTPLKTIHPNTIVFPDWLESFWETAKTMHARHALDEYLPEPDAASAETEVGAGA